MSGRPVAADYELFIRECSDCHKQIMWAKTNASKRQEWMPLDADPVSTGNVLAYPAPDNARLLVCDVLDHRSRRLPGMRADGWLTFQHHRLSCPYADSWARKPRALRPRPTGVRAEPPAAGAHDPAPEGLFDVG